MPRRKIQRSYNKQKIPGDHRLRFYRDAKSGHPFMSISKNFNCHYGHEMTRNPSLTSGKSPRRGYQPFKKNPNTKDKTKSFYHKSIKRIKDVETHLGRRFRRYKNWIISKADLRIIKRLDKKKIKNVRRANDQLTIRQYA